MTFCLLSCTPVLFEKGCPIDAHNLYSGTWGRIVDTTHGIIPSGTWDRIEDITDGIIPNK